MALAVESMADGNTDMAAVNAVIDAVAMNLTTFLGLMGAWTARTATESGWRRAFGPTAFALFLGRSLLGISARVYCERAT
jgi:hypothetical protein